MDCSGLERALIEGKRVDPADPEVRAHLAECASCRFLLEEGPGVAQALASTPAAPAADLDALHRAVAQDIARERGVRAELRALPRAARFVLVALLVAVEALYFAFFHLRKDFASYPAYRMAFFLVGYGSLAAIAAWQALRPIFLPPLPRGVVASIAALALALPLLGAALPELPTLVTSYRHAASDLGCLLNGSVLGLAVLLAARAVDRGSGEHALLGGVVGGLAGLLSLQLECPYNYPGHLLFGHTLVPVALVVAAWGVPRLVAIVRH